MLRKASVHFSDSAFHCCGKVFASKTNLGERNCFRPAHGHGESYSPENSNSPKVILGFEPTLIKPTCPTKQVYDRQSSGGIRLENGGLVLNRTSLPRSPNLTIPPAGGSPISTPATEQLIVKLFSAKRALLFVTLKGTPNGEPKEGAPGTKTGSVGHGGPEPSWYIVATKPRPPTIALPSSHSVTRIQRGRFAGNSPDFWRSDSVITGWRGFPGFLGGCFFTECASVFAALSAPQQRATAPPKISAFSQLL
jgi:hypothetical protein